MEDCQVTPPPTKRIQVKVKPHTIKVPGTKPTNGGSGVDHPVEAIPQNLKRGFFSRCVDVIKSDIQSKVLRTEATFKEPDKNFEDYVRFLEMARKGK
jgi:hypothetical protein